MMGQSASSSAPVDNLTMLKPTIPSTAPDFEHVSKPDFVADAAADSTKEPQPDGDKKDEKEEDGSNDDTSDANDVKALGEVEKCIQDHEKQLRILKNDRLDIIEQLEQIENLCNVHILTGQLTSPEVATHKEALEQRLKKVLELENSNMLKLNDFHCILKCLKNIVNQEHDKKEQDENDATKCSTCEGHGVRVQIREIAPGWIEQNKIACDDCHGEGSKNAQGNFPDQHDTTLRERLKKPEEEKPVVDLAPLAPLAPSASKFRAACANLRNSQEQKKNVLHWLTFFGIIWDIFLFLFAVYHAGKYYNLMPFVLLGSFYFDHNGFRVNTNGQTLLFAINVFLFFEYYVTWWSLFSFTCLYFPIIIFNAF